MASRDPIHTASRVMERATGTKLSRTPGYRREPFKMPRGKRGWAVVEKGGAIQIETIESTKTRVRDNHFTIADEETGAKIKRVKVTVMD